MKSGQKNAKATTRVITQNGNNFINSDMEQKMTINGVSTCTIAGAEKYEKYQAERDIHLYIMTTDMRTENSSLAYAQRLKSAGRSVMNG